MGVGTTPGKGAPREARQFDTTYLTGDTHMVHRDYLAHAFRWGFAHRMCKGKRVLDAGCGPEWNLGKVLQVHGNMGIRAAKYAGVDLSPKLPERRTKLYDLWPELDVTVGWGVLLDYYGTFDVVTSFEVIEHMGEEDGERYLAGLRQLTGGMLLISTPQNNGHRAARNHVKEYSTAELDHALTRAGFEVVRRFGCFGDVRAIAKAIRANEDRFMSEACERVWNELREYYSDDVMACFMAPLYPEACKNVMWVCR
jgi:SAM-dependent methyltransferase